MTGPLGHEIVAAVSIVTITTAMLAAGRRDERSGFFGQRRDLAPSRLAVVGRLAAVALVAALAVVVAFRPHHSPPAASPIVLTGVGSPATHVSCRSPRTPRSSSSPGRPESPGGRCRRATRPPPG